MVKNKIRIAVASSDGIVVNNHFGRASTFYIYDVDADKEIRLVETRKVKPICDGGNHEDNRLKDTVVKFRDCDYLLVSRIGNSAAALAESYGILVCEIPGEIGESIKQLIKNIKVKKYFE